MAVNFSDDADWKSWSEGDYIGIDLKTGRIKLPDDSRLDATPDVKITNKILYAEFNHVEFLEEWIDEKFPQDETTKERDTLVINNIQAPTGEELVIRDAILENATKLELRTETLNVKDNEITLNLADEDGNMTHATTAGIEINRGDGVARPQFHFNQTGDETTAFWGFNFDGKDDGTEEYPVKAYEDKLKSVSLL